MYGYSDESGSPGTANYENDCLLIALVIFESEQDRDEAENAISGLRTTLRLPIDYEFHCSRNTTRVQEAFVKLISRLKFRFIVVNIWKNNDERYATYERISALLIDEIQARFSDIKIEMDTNPALRIQLKKRIYERGLTKIKLREQRSKSCCQIQIADYVANIASKYIKNSKKGSKWFDLIANKAIVLPNKK